MISREEEQKYLNKNSSYLVEQTLLGSLTSTELKSLIKDFESAYNIERNKLLKIYNEKISNTNYKNGSELDKFFVRTAFNIFHGGLELNMYKNVINIFKMYFKVNHTNLYKNNSFVSFDINSTKIIDVISMYIPISKNTRRNFHCKFHEDNTPSFRIYEKSNSRYCFGCNKGGNPANFIADIEGISYTESYKKLINLYR